MKETKINNGISYIEQTEDRKVAKKDGWRAGRSNLISRTYFLDNNKKFRYTIQSYYTDMIEGDGNIAEVYEYNIHDLMKSILRNKEFKKLVDNYHAADGRKEEAMAIKNVNTALRNKFKEAGIPQSTAPKINFFNFRDFMDPDAKEFDKYVQIGPSTFKNLLGKKADILIKTAKENFKFDKRKARRNAKSNDVNSLENAKSKLLTKTLKKLEPVVRESLRKSGYNDYQNIIIKKNDGEKGGILPSGFIIYNNKIKKAVLKLENKSYAQRSTWRGNNAFLPNKHFEFVIQRLPDTDDIDIEASFNIKKDVEKNILRIMKEVMHENENLMIMLQKGREDRRRLYGNDPFGKSKISSFNSPKENVEATKLGHKEHIADPNSNYDNFKGKILAKQREKALQYEEYENHEDTHIVENYFDY